MHIHNRLGMIEGIETMMAQERRLEQVSNNLANVDTAGFKRQSVTFWEMLYQVDAERQRVGKALRVVTDHQQGHTQQTGNPLNIAINGEGFFRIQTDQGVRYTRAGNFELNHLGQLQMPGGALVLGDGGPVVIDGDNFSIDQQGQVLVDGALVNRLAVVTVNDLTAMIKQGRNLFRLTEGGEETPARNFQVLQGFLEKSNVDSVAEMTTMLGLQRNYETQQKMIRTIDEMDDLAVRRVGRLS